MINVRTARRVLSNLEDRRGHASVGRPRTQYVTREEARQAGLKRAKAQKAAVRGLVQLYTEEYGVLYREALRREGIDA